MFKTFRRTSLAISLATNQFVDSKRLHDTKLNSDHIKLRPERFLQSEEKKEFCLFNAEDCPSDATVEALTTD